MKIAVVVPAYNEEKSIYRLVREVQDTQPGVTVVVINDGSRDRTSEEARRGGATVINLPQNVGIGGAVQTGYIYARENHFDIVVQVDADGQHSPDDLKHILSPILSGQADMSIGSRFLEKTDYKPSFFRGLGIRYFSRLTSLLTGQKLTDTTSGYRAVNKNIIHLFSRYYPHDYPEVETVVYAIKNGYRVQEVSVNMNERTTGKSSITPLKSIYYMIKVTFSVLLIKGERHV